MDALYSFVVVLKDDRNCGMKLLSDTEEHYKIYLPIYAVMSDKLCPYTGPAFGTCLWYLQQKVQTLVQLGRTVYPKKYAHGFCFGVLCCGYTLTDFPISIRLTSLALGQSNDCPSASKATLMNMDKYFMWIHYERLHNHNKAKHNKTVCIFLGIYCMYFCQCCRLARLSVDDRIPFVCTATMPVTILDTNVSHMSFRGCPFDARLKSDITPE